MNHKSIIETKVLEKECLEILQEFFKILRSEKKINEISSLFR